MLIADWALEKLALAQVLCKADRSESRDELDACHIARYLFAETTHEHEALLNMTKNYPAAPTIIESYLGMNQVCPSGDTTALSDSS
jgi:hypothetical protein